MLRIDGCCRDEHELVITNEIKRLKKQGYQCQREYEICLGIGKGSKRLRAVVDIRAIKDNVELLIEVGTLSGQHGDRLLLLKKLKPNAKIIHITQWKNWINQFDWENAFYEWEYKKWLWINHPEEAQTGIQEMKTEFKKCQ